MSYFGHPRSTGIDLAQVPSFLLGRILTQHSHAWQGMGNQVPQVYANGDSAQPVLEEVCRGSREWLDVEQLVNQRSEAHSNYYQRDIQIVSVLRISQLEFWQDIERQATADYGNPTRLFHGTSQDAARRIVVSGFTLPTRPGMYGKGIYFAECPLKSDLYAPGRQSGNCCCCCDDLLASLSGRPRTERLADKVMLLCDVYLGNMRRFSHPQTDLTAARDLRPSRHEQVVNCCYCCCNEPSYDSAYAPGRPFCCGQPTSCCDCCFAVNVSEFVIYHHTQAIPRYWIKFDSVGPSRTSTARAAPLIAGFDLDRAGASAPPTQHNMR